MWIRYFATARPLTDGEIEHFINAIQPFFGEWTSHAQPVIGDLMFFENRFIQLRASMLNDASVSGCGIDKAVRELERIALEMGVKWADTLSLFIKSDNVLHAYSRNSLKEAIQKGEVGKDAVFYNLAATQTSDFEQVVGETVFKRYFEALV